MTGGFVPLPQPWLERVPGAPHRIEQALTLSIGFGGINVASAGSL
jgi:hypothetical protein